MCGEGQGAGREVRLADTQGRSIGSGGGHGWEGVSELVYEAVNARPGCVASALGTGVPSKAREERRRVAIWQHTGA